MRSLLTIALLLFFSLPLVAEGRARSQSYPLSVAQPEGWESFPGDPKIPGEILFLQSPQAGDLDALITFTVHPMPGAWSDIVRRENYLMIVHDTAVLENQALTLKGAKGHKWIYRGTSPQGGSKLYYRLYLSLPASVGAKRLLVMQASAPLEQSQGAIATFNELARSLSWGRD